MRAQVRFVLAVCGVATGVVTGAAQQPVTTPPSPVAAASAPAAVANDNRESAGVLKDRVLTLHLVAMNVRWQPEGQTDKDPVRVVQAFAEEGKPPQIPGPLVRVPEGTEIHLTVRNTIPGTPLHLYGMMTRPGAPEAHVEIPEGETRELTFQAGKEGTYFYGATLTEPFLGFHFGNPEATLTGGFIVDPSSGREEPNDRIFIIATWLSALGPAGELKASLTINGRSWPDTERLVLPFGQAQTWRVINASFELHPMHLHGTFYNVESLGTYAADTIYDHDSRRLVTTEALDSGATMKMRWVPDRVGKWLFHCHIQGHVSSGLREGDLTADEKAHGMHGGIHDVEHEMAGLVLGITVQPGDETAAPDLAPSARRKLTVAIDSLPNRYGADPGFGFTITDPERPPVAGDEPPGPSPTLVLQKGEPVAITLVNRTDRETSIHWHGIELESFNDGVAGWSGDSRQTTKPIPAGQSLTVWFTPPRAGTFIYHTHAHDPHQLSSGMYSALLVVPDRKAFNPDVEKVVLLGGSGPGSGGFGLAPLEVNRSVNPLPMTLKVGTTYRFRLIDISPNDTAMVSLRSETGTVQWRAISKDGAALPPLQATLRPATQRIAVGETYDFEYRPMAAGDLRLEVLKSDADVLTTELVHVTN